MKILVTGGLGYIGSHTVCELIEDNNEVIIIDNLSNSRKDVLEKLEKITGKKVLFYQGDVCEKNLLNKVFNENKIDIVIHFAGLKSVSESINKPLEYYSNNLISTLSLLEVMREHDVYNFIFSSSATVYGNQNVPYIETMPRGETTNPYGTTKAMIEKVLEDISISNDKWNIVILRYFNPAGAHESGLLGEVPNGIPNNLMPYITQVAVGKLEQLKIYGDDYLTVDGTGVRDFIHVVDLAKGHVKTIDYMKTHKGLNIFNLGTENGFSVLEIIKTFESVNKVKINYKIVDRRPGDLPICYADVSKAKEELGWRAEKTLEDICRDAWNFEKGKEND